MDKNNSWRQIRVYAGIIVGLALLMWGIYAGIRNSTQNSQVDQPTRALEIDQPAATSDETDANLVISASQLPHLPPLNLNAIPLRQDTSLKPNLNPVTFQGKRPTITYTTYLVKRGDTPNIIADNFGIEASTLLGGNPQLSDEANLLQAGQEIIILPIDGVLHDVRRGDTIQLLADQYGTAVDEIINYQDNQLEFPYRLYEDTQIMIPGAVREIFVWTPPTISTGSGGSGFGGFTPQVRGTGSFIWPVSGRRITQYYHYFHRGVDIALPVGSPTYASDTGTVVWAGWNNTGYGGLIVLDHGNGYLTFYAHLSGYNVVPGQIVYQGNIIGYTGNTGRSSGPHIHFEIRLNGIHQDPFWSGYLN